MEALAPESYGSTVTGSASTAWTDVKPVRIAVFSGAGNQEVRMGLVGQGNAPYTLRRSIRIVLLSPQSPAARALGAFSDVNCCDNPALAALQVLIV